MELKLLNFYRRVDSLEKTLMLGGIGGRRRGDDRGWDGWMASLTRWTWVWVNSGSWWWTGRPGVLRFMGLQRVGHDWVAELNWAEFLPNLYCQPHLLLLSLQLSSRNTLDSLGLLWALLLTVLCPSLLPSSYSLVKMRENIDSQVGSCSLYGVSQPFVNVPSVVTALGDDTTDQSSQTF